MPESGYSVYRINYEKKKKKTSPRVLKEQLQLYEVSKTDSDADISTKDAESTTPGEQLDRWDQCICTNCGKHLVGYLCEEHTNKVHNGINPGYKKVEK